MTHDTALPDHDDDNKLTTERREKLAGLRAEAKAAGLAVFPNDFKPRHQASELQQQYGALDNAELEPQAIAVVVAGRMMLKRVMGKASFATLQDGSFGPKGSEDRKSTRLNSSHLRLSRMPSSA